MQNGTSGGRDRNYNRKMAYVDGNTVRRMEAVPAVRQRPEDRRKRREEEELLRRKRAAARNRERALRMSKGYVVFLTMACAVFAAFCGIYIQLQADVTARLKTIANLESQIEDLKADNDEAYKRINTSVDLDAVRERAIDGLGMFYAGEDQVIYYSVEKSDYMNQYGAIPEE